MFYIKQNDTSPALRASLLDADRNPVDITGATVNFHMHVSGGSTPVVDASATIIDAVTGVVEYGWSFGDTAESGNYDAEFEVTYGDASIETFPNNQYIKIKITPEIT